MMLCAKCAARIFHTTSLPPLRGFAARILPPVSRRRDGYGCIAKQYSQWIVLIIPDIPQGSVIFPLKDSVLLMCAFLRDPN
jgi:hypothetical protein